MIRTAMDPVCEMEIRPEDAVAVARFEGHRVYFCSQNCYAEFLDIPHRYVGWDDDPGRRRGHRRLRLDLRRKLAGGRTGR
jgi:YHS domain-containing protein